MQRSIKYVNGQVFTGDEWMSQALITTQNGSIVSVAQNGPADEVIDLKGGKLVPAFIDIQLYGGNGMFFGEHPTVAALEATVNYSRAGGAFLILPTVATNSNEVAFAAIDAVKAYWSAGGKGDVGPASARRDRAAAAAPADPASRARSSMRSKSSSDPGA